MEEQQKQENIQQKQQNNQQKQQNNQQKQDHNQQKQEQNIEEEYQDAVYTDKDDNKQSWLKVQWLKLKEFFVECKRVLIVTKKPTGEEFKTIVKVSGLGILIIGAIGFIIQLFEILIKK